MLGGDGRGLPNRQAAPLPALRGRSGQDPSVVPLLQERTGVTYLNMLNQSGVPFAVRLLPVPLRRMNLQLKVAPLPALSPRRPFGVPLGLDEGGRVPVSVRRRSKVAEASPS